MTEIKLRTKLSAYTKGVIPTKVSELDFDIDAPKDGEIYARKDGHWASISTEQNNESYVRKNDEWVDLGEELQRKTYRTHEQITDEIDSKIDSTKQWADAKFIDNTELENRIDIYDTEIKNHISQNYVNNTTFNTYKSEADAKFIDGTELATELDNYVTTTELNNRDYVADIPTANNKVYARKRGQWEELDLDNMGAINIDTPINSGLISDEIPKEESHEARNKYVIEMNKWEGTQAQFEQDISLNPIMTDINITSYSILKRGCELKKSSKIRGEILQEDTTLTLDIELNINDKIKTGSIITYNSIINNISPYIEAASLEDGKFYYVVDPIGQDELLNGGNSQTNQFQRQVDILTTRFQLRTDTKANWETYNPILGYGEPGWEIDTHKLKVGDGVRTWNNLPYQSGENLNKEVLTNLTIQSNGDNLSLNREYTNLHTDVKTYSPIAVPLVDNEQAGLMATADYIALQDVISRVEDLEGKTTRLLYLNTPVTQDIEIVIDSVLEMGSILKEGSIVNGVQIGTDTALLIDTDLIIGDLIKTGSTIANSSLINNITYPNKNTINTFVIGEGYTSPFEGIAVVINGTYHIWHYYENDNVGWKDDGLDTVSNFTNNTAGVILGSTQNGKVFAENDGTGSVVGWDNLTNRVGTNESNISGLELDVTSLQTNVGQAQQDISQIQGNITNIQSNIGIMQTSIGNIENDVTSIKNAKVTEITEESTNATYPSSAAVYEFVTNYTPEITSLTNEEIDEMWEEEPTPPQPEDGEIVEITSNNYTIQTDIDGGDVYIITTEEPIYDGIVNIESNNFTTYQDVDGGTVYQIYN